LPRDKLGVKTVEPRENLLAGLLQRHNARFVQVTRRDKERMKTEAGFEI